MALTTVEQLQLLSEGFPNLTQPLDAVIYQQALNTCVAFTNAEKDTTPGGEMNQAAEAYLQKMKRVIRLVQEGNRSIASTLTQVMIARVGVVVPHDFAVVQNADQAAIVGFFAANMLAVLEGFAGVDADERTAYNALP